MPSFAKKASRIMHRLAEGAVNNGLPPSLIGYRHVKRETVPEYFRRVQAQGGSTDAGTFRVLQPEQVERHPLPCNVGDREELPATRGWWGYSFRDVPERRSGPTFLATLPRCKVVPCFDARGEFWTTILHREGRALEMRELSFRPWQARYFRLPVAQRVARATWVVERVYDNYSHWLTAHLPKLLFLREHGLDEEVMLPATLAPVVRQSLEAYGFAPERYRTFSPGQPLQVDELTVVGTDRFRPELLRLVARHCPVPLSSRPERRVFISRSKAARRRLLNEEEIWPILARAGFEKVFMEDLTFAGQMALMRETKVLVAPHGAGLTNMMFCPEGSHVVEMADLSFPNPNFYAVAAAMGLSYWLVSAQAEGACHPLDKDMRVDPRKVREIVEQIV